MSDVYGACLLTNARHADRKYSVVASLVYLGLNYAFPPKASLIDYALYADDCRRIPPPPVSINVDKLTEIDGHS